MNEELPELSFEDFVRARKFYWEQKTGSSEKGMAPPKHESMPAGEDGSSFILYSPGPEGLFAVFEDSGQAGWFYLYGGQRRSILKSAHLYDRASVTVDEDVVDIGWAEDGSACGLAVWGEFRAFLGVSTDLDVRKPLLSPDETGIEALHWPPGFERYLDKRID